METLIKNFFSYRKIAVVGSFRNEEKVAYKIFRNLRNKGYEVYPVNPNKDEIDGVKCYKSVKDLPEDVKAIDFVTPPEVTEELLEICKDKGVEIVWLQPGAESKKAIDFCKNNGIKLIYGTCLMMEG